LIAYYLLFIENFAKNHPSVLPLNINQNTLNLTRSVFWWNGSNS